MAQYKTSIHFVVTSITFFRFNKVDETFSPYNPVINIRYRR